MTAAPDSLVTITTPDLITIMGPLFSAYVGWHWTVRDSNGREIATRLHEEGLDAGTVLDWFRREEEARRVIAGE